MVNIQMTYSELLDILNGYAEKEFANFQRRLIFTKYEILGVRTPILHRLAKKYAAEFSRDSKNLLLIGTTGTGKTHITTAIAKTIIENGFEVIYEVNQK